MAFDKNNNIVGGLSGSSLGQKATQTRIRSMSGPQWDKLKEELQAYNPNEKESEEKAALEDTGFLEEMLTRDNKNA